MSAQNIAGLDRLFRPRSIAVVGASASESKVGYQLVDALRGFDGQVFPINPKATQIAGRQSYPQLSALPVVPDLVLLGVPANACVDALTEAARIGVGGAVIVGGGFAESGPDGAALQAQIERVCKGSSLRLLGPNTSGYTRPGTGCHACFLPTVQQFAAGPLSIVAQSGGVNLTLALLAHRQRLGIRLAVGLGNAVDVDAADVIEYLAHDPQTKMIGLHLEGVAEGRRLYDVLSHATTLKPVIVLPVGRAQVADFAQSHTGNLMGQHAVTVAALRQAGAIVVDATQSLVDAAVGFLGGRIAPKANPGVGIVTGQAGPGLIILDALRSAAVNVPTLAPATVAEISKHLPPLTYLQNPIDTGRPSPLFADVMVAASRDPAIDAIITFALDEPAAIDAVAVFERARKDIKQPLVFATLGLEGSVDVTQNKLQSRDIPALESPERGAVAVRALVDDAKAQYRRLITTRTVAAAGRVIARALDEASAKALLAEFGIRSPRSRSCRNEEEAVTAFDQLDKPVVVKVLDPRIAHKTEVGGVHLGVRTADQLSAALQKIDAIPGDISDRGYLIEEMASSGIDLILGARRDPSFGATVLLGLGGTEAEALKDVSIRLAPLDRVDVEEMLRELRGSALLDGWRGAPAVDRDAIIDAVVAVADLMEAAADLRELDINPLRCTSKGVQALDALMIWSD
ncbi:acetyltransferase [Povalibacter uvarum]|uniref:Acetyltransferase n=1 Tax=Povalibacter uvarum TaxID=732238 RepID=A0A841HNH1_9GAMM|nr:acetate--CoA ligase family protein [Povalibacter uvarum]MBB6093820.1 acetyltransferase [Povalibacter uvarum]